MQSRKVGGTETQIMPIGSGSWTIGGSGRGPDDEEPVAAIGRARKHGSYRAGMAAFYGHSEETEASCSGQGF